MLPLSPAGNWGYRWRIIADGEISQTSISFDLLKNSTAFRPSQTETIAIQKCRFAGNGLSCAMERRCKIAPGEAVCSGQEAWRMTAQNGSTLGETYWADHEQLTGCCIGAEHGTAATTAPFESLQIIKNPSANIVVDQAKL